jgi:phosphatidylserine decarboxylase
MYHRFHAPHDGTVEHVSYLSGDTWNVNPIALKRVERLFCRNERAVIRLRLANGTPLALVPVAAILVASIRLHFLNVLLHLRYGLGPTRCPAARRAQGPGTGLVRARLHHHRVCAPGLCAGSGHPEWHAHSHGTGLDALARRSR